MRDKLLDDWLTSATEVGFQYAFAASLANDGYRVIHVTCHNSREHGKDLLAIAPDGTPCAFQLKSTPRTQLTLSVYRSHVEGVREWPFDGSTFARFGLYLMIPLGSWVGGAFVERLLSSLLD